MLTSYVDAALICAFSYIVGAGILRMSGLARTTWAAPGVGLAALLAVEPVAVRLPGHGVTALVVMLLLCGAGGVAARRALLPPNVIAPLVVGALLLITEAIPFVANWRYGPLGVSFNDDLGPHFLWSDALRTGNDVLFRTIIPGYPIGPHALVAALAELSGTRALEPFTGLMLAVPVLTAWTAFSILEGLRRWAQVVGAALTGLPFLCAAYFAQGAFKEPLQALLVLALVVVLLDIRRDGDLRLRRAVPYAVLVAGSVSQYGPPGALYAGVFVVAWLTAECLFRRRIPAARDVVPVLRLAAMAVFVAVVIILPQVPRLRHFSPTGAAGAGNVPTNLRAFAILGLWPTTDFRFDPGDLFGAGFLAAVAVAAAIYACAWWVRRGDLIVPVAALAGVAVYAYTRHGQLPYVTTKTMTIIAPLLTVTVLRALLDFTTPPTVELRTAVAVAAAIFIGAAAWSSGLMLRNARVGPMDHMMELATLRPIVRGHATLFLLHDDYVPWELEGALVSTPLPYAIPSLVPFAMRPTKPLAQGAALDFDSIDPRTLDRFDYAVTTSATYASIPPSNWHVARRLRWYTLWRRVGPTVPREILGEGQNPGTSLACPSGAAGPTALPSGVAGVMSPPRVASARAWTLDGIHPPAFSATGYAAIGPGEWVQQQFDLSSGRWSVSVQYASPTAIRVSVGDRASVELPANLEREGTFWRVGTITTGSTSVLLRVTAERAKFALASPSRAAALVGSLAFTPIEPEQTVPLANACGLYVDWYRAG
jgi:hypothetical protein